MPDGARGKGECGGDLGVGPAWTTAEALAGAFSAPTGLMPGPERRPIRSRSTPRRANCNRPSANSGTSPGDCTPWSSGMPDWPLPFGRRRIQPPENHRNPADRYSDVVESTAYMLVAHCSEAGPSTVAARADQSTLVVDVEIDGRPELLGEIAYRITTLVEGSLTSDFRNGRTRMTLMRPL